MTLVAGIDSSTQSCKVVIRDLDTGAVVRTGRASHPTGTEVDPWAWWDALGTAIADAGGLDDIAAVAIAGQQHGMVLLDAGGNVIRPALLWNDTRSADAAVALTAELGAADLARRTGSVPVASFTGTKLRWVRDNEPEHAARVAAVALPHDWLTWRLRGFGPVGESEHGPDLEQLVTDRSDASGTGYWNPGADEYDLELFELMLGRPGRVASPSGGAAAVSAAAAADASSRSADASSRSAGASSRSAGVVLPRVLGHADRAGIIAGSPAQREGGVPNSASARTAEIVVGAGAGDNAGAALGLGASAGDVIVSIGTSGTVFAVTDAVASDESGTVAGFADASGRFLPLVATLNAARILDSIAQLLGVDHTELGRLALEAEPGCDGLVLVPYFEGERTPNRPNATASLSGMTLASTSRTNLARAAIEGLLSGLADGLDAVRATGVRETRLLLIGGAAQNEAVARIAAQVFDAPVVVPAPAEYVADGAAVQAAWALTGSRPEWTVTMVSQPTPDPRPIIREQYSAAVAESG